MDTTKWVPLERCHMHLLFMLRADWNIGNVEVTLFKSKSINKLVAFAIFTFVIHSIRFLDNLKGGQQAVEMNERCRKDAEFVLCLGVEAHRDDFLLSFDNHFRHLNKLTLV